MKLKKFLDQNGVWCERIYHENLKKWKKIKLYNMALSKGDVGTIGKISQFVTKHWKGKVTWYTTTTISKRTGHTVWSLVFRLHRN